MEGVRKEDAGTGHIKNLKPEQSYRWKDCGICQGTRAPLSHTFVPSGNVVTDSGAIFQTRSLQKPQPGVALRGYDVVLVFGDRKRDFLCV